MKLNRFIALTVITLLVVGAMGVVSMKVFAQTTAQAQTYDQKDDDTAEAQDASSTDKVDLQCDNQNKADGQESIDAADTDNVDEQVGDQNQADGSEVESVGDAESAPTGTPAISAEVAQKTAESYLNAGTAIKVELDDENGKLVYSVEFSNGTDVKVDAMAGSVLGTEPTEN